MSPPKQVNRSSPVNTSANMSFKNANASLSGNKFRNPQLEAATAELEAEFNRVLKTGVSNNRAPAEQNDDFYKMLGDFNQSPDHLKRHVSPTKRLIAQKNSTWEHKDAMRNCRRTQKYGLHYTTSPGKSYIIEPDGNELDYRKAYKDPLAFYDQVMTQQVT